MQLSHEIVKGDNLIICPNPFYDKVQISVPEAKGNPISVNIFNLTGKLVFSEDFSRFCYGINSIQWQGINNEGTPVEPGIYFIRIQVGDELMDSKVIKMK